MTMDWDQPGNLIWFGAILHLYFHLSSIEPSNGREEAKFAWRLLSFPASIRTGLCLGALVILGRGEKLDNPFLNATLLTFLISPLQVPTLLEPKPGDSVRPGRFILKWILAELDKGVKTLLLGAIIWVLFRLPFWSPADAIKGFSQGVLRLVPARETGLSLDPTVFVVAAIVLCLKMLMLALLPSKEKKWYTTPVPLVACTFFSWQLMYSIGGQMYIPSGWDWEAPAGFLAGTAFKCMNAYFAAIGEHNANPATHDAHEL